MVLRTGRGPSKPDMVLLIRISSVVGVAQQTACRGGGARRGGRQSSSESGSYCADISGAGSGSAGAADAAGADDVGGGAEPANKRGLG